MSGDAALQFDPDDHRAIAAALERLLCDDALVERLVAAGHERVAQFTWARTAELTLAGYERAAA